jgi:hypothetical protein
VPATGVRVFDAMEGGGQVAGGVAQVAKRESPACQATQAVIKACGFKGLRPDLAGDVRVYGAKYGADYIGSGGAEARSAHAGALPGDSNHNTHSWQFTGGGGGTAAFLSLQRGSSCKWRFSSGFPVKRGYKQLQKPGCPAPPKKHPKALLSPTSISS